MADMAPPSSKDAAIGCSVILVVAFGIAAYSCHADEALQQATFDRSSAIAINASDLASEWSDNEVAAARKFANKSIALSGTVNSISADGDHPGVKLDSGDVLHQVDLILREVDDAIPLRPGDQVTFDCVGARQSLGSVVVDSCALTKRASP